MTVWTPRGRDPLTTIALVVGAIVCSVHALAADPLERAEVLDRIRRAYTAPWAERVTVAILVPTEGGWTEREHAVLRAHFDPARGLLLDFGEVCTHVHAGRLTVWRAEGGAVYRQSGDPARPLGVLAQRLPPIWLPQGAAAFNEPLTRLPILGRPGAAIDWAGHARPMGPDRVRLRGEFEAGEVEMDVSPETGRITQFAVGGSRGAARWRIVLSSTPLEPDADEFDIVPGEDAQVVSSLAGLGPGVKPTSAGERVPDLGLVDGAGRHWDLLDRLERDIALATAARAEIPPVLVLLLLFEAVGDEHATDLGEKEFLKLHRVADALRVELASRLAPGDRQPDLVVHAAAVFDLRGYALSRYEALDTSWREVSASRPRYRKELGSLLWSTSPDATIRLFSTDEPCVLVVIGPDRRLIRAGSPAEITAPQIADRVLRRDGASDRDD